MIYRISDRSTTSFYWNIKLLHSVLFYFFLIPLERQTLISRNNTHQKYAFHPRIPHISRFP